MTKMNDKGAVIAHKDDKYPLIPDVTLCVERAPLCIGEDKRGERRAERSHGRWSASHSARLELFSDLRNNIEQVCDESIICDLEDRRFRILIDRDNRF